MEPEEVTATEVASEVMEVAHGAVSPVVIEDKGVLVGGCGDVDSTDNLSGIDAASGEQEVHYPTEGDELTTVSATPISVPTQLEQDSAPVAAASPIMNENTEAVTEMAAVTAETVITATTATGTRPPAEDRVPENENGALTEDLSTAVEPRVMEAPLEELTEASAVSATGQDGNVGADGSRQDMEQGFPSEETSPSEERMPGAAFSDLVVEPTAEPLDAETWAESVSPQGSARGLMAGLMSSLGLGETNAAEGTESADVAVVPNVGEVAMTTDATTGVMLMGEIATNVTAETEVTEGFPTEEEGRALYEETGRGNLLEEGFPTEEEGIEPAAEAEGAGMENTPTYTEGERSMITAEMRDFLEDSEGEEEQAVDGQAALTLEPAAVEAPRVQGPRSPTYDTEFSARHAQKVIGSGVVLERKASISSVAMELKNKSGFSAEDAAATIKSGAISERTRLLKEEQEALKAKHATERQDTDLPNISKTIIREGSVKGKSQMYQQALTEGEGGDKPTKSAPVPRNRLKTDWTQRRESLEQFVVQYVPPPLPENSTVDGPSTSNTHGDGPVRYIPRPKDITGPNSRSTSGGNSNSSSRGSSPGGGSFGAVASIAKQNSEVPGSPESSSATTRSGTEPPLSADKVSNTSAQASPVRANGNEASAYDSQGADEVRSPTDVNDASAPPTWKTEAMITKDEYGNGAEKMVSSDQKASVGIGARNKDVDTALAAEYEVTKPPASSKGVPSKPAAPEAISNMSRQNSSEPSTSGGCCIVS